MPSLARAALATLVVIAGLSVGVDAAIDASHGHRDPVTCDDARLTVYPDDFGTTGRYADLSPDARAAFHRARTADDRTVSVDPAVVSAFPASVVYNGTAYRTNALAFDCPAVAGVPGWLDPIVLTFDFVHHVFGGLYRPVGAVVLVALGYRKVDDWLQFG